MIDLNKLLKTIKDTIEMGREDLVINLTAWNEINEQLEVLEKIAKCYDSNTDSQEQIFLKVATLIYPYRKKS